jgi:multicomponent Na+:H+ antiporter subunit D
VSQLAPLSVAVPLLVAAVLAMFHSLLKRVVYDLVAIATAAATFGMTLLLLVHVSSGIEVYWFGGWHPRHGVAIGIAFTVGAIGAGLAAFVSLLMVLALIYSTRYIGVESPYYHVLMLTFMAGIVGFCLSGDVFNMFVMFELMSVSAVALIGYKVREQASIEGALNFAVINMIGSFLFLLGIGLIYAHTGALNLAQIGTALAHLGNGRVVVISFALLACALLIKAAVVPFHFWLDDAYAVALDPVCLLLAGAMSEIGLYGLARLWFSAFSPALGGTTETVRAILVGIGLVTAIWGAAMSLLQDHLKRMLAFVTISFVGVFLTGMGLLTEEGVAGTAVYVLADGFGKALLFACVGILQTRFGKVGQCRLHGRGRALSATGALFAAGGLLIAALPPFGPFLGKSMIEDAAVHAGYGFVPPFVMLASALCGAAVLAAAARVFLGWGATDQERPDDPDEDTSSETGATLDSTPAVMFVPTVLLFLGAAGVGVWFGFADLAATAAHAFVDFPAYRDAVFGAVSHGASAASSSPEWFDYLYCGGATVLAILIAAFALWGRRAGHLARMVLEALRTMTGPIQRLHTGRIGDYTAALALGVGVFAGLMTLTLR